MLTDTLKPSLRKVKIFQSYITSASYSEVLQEVMRLGRQRAGAYVCFANAHMMVEAQQDPSFNCVLNQAQIATPDGRPISVLMRLLYGIRQPRICGMDIFPDILKEAQRQSLSVFFYGSTPEVLDRILHRAAQENPGLTIAGSYSPPFRRLTAEEDALVVEKINHSEAHLVFVSLGCPKQEKWMYEHCHSIQACMLAIGQAFLTYTGQEKRLPPWARNLSLEWAYRLYLEPKRLWKRYLIGNSTFLFLATRMLLTYKLKTGTHETF